MTDEELAQRYLALRDPADFRLLVERTSGNVLRLVSSVLGPFRDTDAEEAVQEVFIRAHAKLSQFRGDALFATWLYRLAYRVAVNHIRTARFRLPHESAEVLHGLTSSDDQLQQLFTAERVELVGRALDELPDLYRTVIDLYYWHELPVAEIATYIGAPENTVKSYLARARERLRRSLKEKGVTE